MSERERTKTAPEAQRGGTYEHERAASALLGYYTRDIHDLRSSVTTIGSADRGVDIRLATAYVSAKHCRIELRARGAMLVDHGSKNGTYRESKRTFGLGLKASFEEAHVGTRGVILMPGTTFVVADRDHRYIAIDPAMRTAHPALEDILGTEDEVRDIPELVSPSDLILAADSGGHMLITGEPGCEQETLARIVHQISKRRCKRLVECACVPGDWQARGTLLDAVKATFLLKLSDDAERIDSRFLSRLFSSADQIRVIVLARTVTVAHAALGPAYVRPMMHVGLRPLARRRTAIPRLLDSWLARNGSPLRVADLTAENQRALRVHRWRGNLTMLRETAERLDAIIRAPEFCRNQARQALGIPRNTFFEWFRSTLRLSMPLMSDERARVIRDRVREQR